MGYAWQKNTPTKPGRYRVRWQHGTDRMKEWREVEVGIEIGELELFVDATNPRTGERTITPLSHWADAEWEGI